MIEKIERDFAVVTGAAVHGLVFEDVAGCLEVIRNAYLLHDAGQTVNPQSVFLRFPDHPRARIIGLPAHFRGSSGLSGMKWIASYPDNPKQGLPRASAVLILNDAEVGFPFACLEGSIISAARTVASAVLATELLHGHGKTIDRLGVVGTGLIARYFVQFLVATGWKLKDVCCYDLDPGAIKSFSNWLEGVNGDGARAEPSADAVLANSDVALFATVAAEPHVDSLAAIAHAPSVLHLSLRDLAPQLILASQNVVDDPKHVLAAGTSIALAHDAAGHTEFINCTLADLLRAKYRLDPDKPRVFSPFGLGMLDLALGKWVYDRALESHRTTIVPGFFSHTNVPELVREIPSVASAIANTRAQ